MKPKTIVVIDDEESILDFVKYNLKKEGYEVTTFDEAFSAMSHIKSNLPSLVISDWMMPGKSGMDLLCDFRNDTTLKCIPFIMMTCKNSITDINRAFHNGANDYLVKPFRLDELRSRVQRLVSL
jgi:DNA-binding response OmpR family regulator